MILGKEVAVLVNETQPHDNYGYTFNGTKLTSGIYFYQLQIGDNFADRKKMLIIN